MPTGFVVASAWWIRGGRDAPRPLWVQGGGRSFYFLVYLISFHLRGFLVSVLSMLCMVYNLTDVKNDKATNCHFCLKTEKGCSAVKAPGWPGFSLLARAFPSHILLSVSWHFCQFRTGGHRCWRQVRPHFYSPLHFQRLWKSEIKPGLESRVLRKNWGRGDGGALESCEGQGYESQIHRLFSGCWHPGKSQKLQPFPQPDPQFLRHRA